MINALDDRSHSSSSSTLSSIVRELSVAVLPLLLPHAQAELGVGHGPLQNLRSGSLVSVVQDRLLAIMYTRLM